MQESRNWTQDLPIPSQPCLPLDNPNPNPSHSHNHDRSHSRNHTNSNSNSPFLLWMRWLKEILLLSTGIVRVSVQAQRGRVRVRPVQGGNLRPGGDQPGRLQGLLLFREDLLLLKPWKTRQGQGWPFRLNLCHGSSAFVSTLYTSYYNSLALFSKSELLALTLQSNLGLHYALYRAILDALEALSYFIRKIKN